MSQWRVIVVAALVALSSRVAAQEVEAGSHALDLQVHAFVSQGFLVSSHNNYLADSTSGSFEFAEVGINFTKSLSDDLRIGLQLFARDLGPIGRYTARVDWFYLDYRYADWLGLRAGRVKLPFGLYNEYNDIDAGRTAVLLPQSVYPTQNRDYLLAQTGGEIYGRLGLGAAGALDYRLYGGTVYFEIEPAAESRFENVQIPYLAGARLLWEPPVPGLRLGGSVQTLQLEGDLFLQGTALENTRTQYMLSADFDGRFEVRLPVLLWVASVEYSWRELLLAAEYSRWEAELETNPPLPPIESTSERAYVLLTYRVNTWLQPGIYYSWFFPNVERRTGRENQQHDLAATLRFDINPYWLVKLEGHYIHGTADLNPNLNDGKQRNQLTRRWTLFLAKTTAYF